MTAEGKPRVVAEAADCDLPGHCEAALAPGSAGATSRPPLKAIRAECLECCNGKPSEVRLCVSKRCPVWLYRFGRRPTEEEIARVADVATYPLERGATQAEVASGGSLKAIRARCLDCSGNSFAEVRRCKHDTCPLHPFRMGHNPNIRLSPERKAELRARLQR